MKRSIYDAPVTKTTINKKQLQELVQFLVMHRQDLTLPADVIRRIMTMRSISQTPISRIFTRAVELGRDRLVGLVNVPSTIKSAPEVITYQHVSFDAVQMGEVDSHLTKALEVTEFHNKVIVNVTPWLSRSGELSDQLMFQALVVRDLLSRSYYNADRTWISPSFMRQLCKVYSMSLSQTVGAIYNLTYPEQTSVATVFAYYFFSMVMPEGQAEESLVASASFLKLGDTQSVRDIVDLIKHEKEEYRLTDRTLSLDNVCMIVSRLGIQRMTLDRRTLHTRVRSWGPDVHSSALALEYPPYWLYLMLLAGSGRKIGLLFTLKRIGVDREIAKMADELLSPAGFLGGLH